MTEKEYRAEASTHDLYLKNQIYNDAASLVWQLAVYNPVHQGREFTNIGGVRILEDIGRRANLDQSKNVLELCCGLGVTCRYLSERFGCSVTGIDINRFQIDYAEKYPERNGKGSNADITFICDDIVQWTPIDSYDVVFVMDSLTMIDAPQEIVAKASQCLNVGGSIALAEVLAGKNIDNETRRTCWEEDGFVNLIHPERYCTYLNDAGISEVKTEDLTSLAEECFATIGRSVRDQKEQIVMSGGLELYDSWSQISEFYRCCFAERRLAYNYFTGVRL